MVSYQNGDYASFEILYWRHSGKVYAFLKNRLGTADEANDLMQQIFLKLHKYRDRYNGNFPFLPWLFSIARNVLIDWTRKHKAIPTIEESLEEHSSHVEEEGRPELTMEKAVESLTPAQRKLILMRFKEGFSFNEISEKTGLTSTSARKRVSRILGQLRNTFSAKKGGEK